MKKTCLLFMIFALLISLCSCSNSSTPNNLTPTETTIPTKGPLQDLQTEDPEILRAVAYGFVPAEIIGNWDAPMTFSEYCGLLKNFLSFYDNNLVTKWEDFSKKEMTSADPISRDHAMSATYYVASLMGLGKTTNGNWNYMAQVVGINSMAKHDDLYSRWSQVAKSGSPFLDIAYKNHNPGWDFVSSSQMWNLAQTSPVSGKTIFDIDYEQKTNRPMDKLTRKEAVWAVLRLYESTFTAKEDVSANDPQSVEILSLSDKRKNEIVNSETTIQKSDTFVQGETYTGTAYYVSNTGDDANNGKSPETSWATMQKVNDANLQYGDAVFFKRGDTWYDQLWGKSGVTYSAYGTGSKPVISGSVEENAANPELWEFYSSGDNGEKIWVYKNDLLDVSGVFFNNGESWANKVFPYWDGTQYLNHVGDSFDVSKDLSNNLDFFADVDLTKINPMDRVAESGVTGPLYLRSDEGNPGELFSNIEFSQDGTGISPVGENGKDLTVDNLKIVYFGMLGVSSAGYQGWTNTIVQNSEIGWCGGGITQYSYEISEDFAVALTSGGAIQLSGPQNTARNNYIHHCDSKAIVLVIHDRESASLIYYDDFITGNLFEYNAAVLHLADYLPIENPELTGGFKNVNFEDNYVLYSGFGWVTTKTDRQVMMDKMPLYGMDFGGDFVNNNEGIYFTNNIFFMAKEALIYCYMPKETQPIFSGNTYAQSENGSLAMLRGRLLSITENGEDYVHNELMDQTGTVLVVK